MRLSEEDIAILVTIVLKVRNSTQHPTGIKEVRRILDTYNDQLNNVVSKYIM